MAGLLDKFASAFEAYNHLFHDLSRPVADVFGLRNLGPHFDVFVYSFMLFNFANIVLVPGLSMLFFNRTYGSLDAKVRNKWYVTFPLTPFPRRSSIHPSSGRTNVSIFCGHVVRIWVSAKLIPIHRPSPRNCRGVSLIHVSIVIPMVIRCLDSPVLSADRAFGWDERAGTAVAVAAGYFLWDTADMVMHFEAFGFVAHGSCHPHDIRPMHALTGGKLQVRRASSCTFYVS